MINIGLRFLLLALVIQIFLLQQKYADVKQRFLCLRWKNANLCRQLFFTYLNYFFFKICCKIHYITLHN